MSKINICNQALGIILTDTISSLDDVSSKEAKVANMYYDQCRQLVLREFLWNFATIKKQYGLVDEDNKLGWNYVYQYPSDCMYLSRVTNYPSLSLFGGGLPNEIKEAEIFDIGVSSTGDSKYIYSNVENAYCVYTGDIKNVFLFDPLFTECLVYLLANKFALSLTGNTELVQYTQQLYMMNLISAKQANAQEGNVVTQKFDTYKRARRI